MTQVACILRQVAERLAVRLAREITLLEWGRDRAEADAKALRKTLAIYWTCRHACLDCFCTKEARTALAGPDGKGTK